MNAPFKQTFHFIARICPARLAAEQIRENRTIFDRKYPISHGYEIITKTIVEFERTRILKRITTQTPPNLHFYLEPPVTRIDLKSAMLQARIIRMPQILGIQSKRAKEILTTEQPYMTLSSILGWPKEKKSIFQYLTDLRKQSELDYIDKGIGSCYGEIARMYQIQDSSSLAKFLNAIVIEMNLELVAANAEYVASFSLDETIVCTYDPTIPEHLFARTEQLA